MPDIEIVDQTDSVNFTINTKQTHPNTRLPLTLTANEIEIKLRWLSEIKQYAADPLTLHEHNVDDLRIDPSQIKPDSEYEHFQLPIQRKASYESDGIRPSEVARDYFLTEEERAYYAKQHAEDQKILQQQQKEFDQKKNLGIVPTQTQTQTQVQIQTQARAQTQQIKSESVSTKLLSPEEKSNAQTENVKLSRSIAIEQTVESKTKTESESPKTIITKELLTDHKDNIAVVEDSKQKASVKTIKEEEVKISQKIENSVQSIREAGKLDSVTSQILAVGSEDIQNLNNKVNLDVDDKNLAITLIDTNTVRPIVTMHAGDSTTNALDMLTKSTPADSPQDATNNTNTSNQNRNENVTSRQNNQIALTNQVPLHRLQTISLFNFGDRPGAPGRPPVPNLPDFLMPPHLITYETSIEINFRKIPPPQPPPPPKFIKKMLVHTESLERRTRAFLTGNFEVGTTDNSLRNARQKIRSLKSTILKSDDEVKHAEDTITKAQSGDFINIFAPPIVEPPLYEFVEVPTSQRSEDECSDNLDRRSERSQSVQKQELENMEDYYSSKYSSRSSRRRVEGNWMTMHSTSLLLFL